MASRYVYFNPPFYNSDYTFPPFEDVQTIELREFEQVQTIELRVKLCCDNCVNKVKKCFEKMDGIERVDCCQWTQKVIVKGTVKPEDALKKVKKVDPCAELWNK